jgi:hypothetical protein
MWRFRPKRCVAFDRAKASSGFADTLSAAPLTCSLRRADSDLVVFCFAKPEDAEAFAERFGGKRVAGWQGGETDKNMRDNFQAFP